MGTIDLSENDDDYKFLKKMKKVLHAVNGFSPTFEPSQRLEPTLIKEVKTTHSIPDVSSYPSNINNPRWPSETRYKFLSNVRPQFYRTLNHEKQQFLELHLLSYLRISRVAHLNPDDQISLLYIGNNFYRFSNGVYQTHTATVIRSKRQDNYDAKLREKAKDVLLMMGFASTEISENIFYKVPKDQFKQWPFPKTFTRFKVNLVGINRQKRVAIKFGNCASWKLCCLSSSFDEVYLMRSEGQLIRFVTQVSEKVLCRKCDSNTAILTVCRWIGCGKYPVSYSARYLGNKEEERPLIYCEKCGYKYWYWGG